MIHSYTSIDTYQNCPRQMYERYISKTAPFVDTPETLEGKRVHKLLEKRVLFGNALPAELQPLESVCASVISRGTPFAEIKLGVDRELRPAQFFDHDVYIRGVLDVLLLTEHWKKGFVIDWKTGKNREAGKEPLQLMLSAAYTFANHDECETVTALNVYTKTGQLGTAHTWTRSELPTIWRTILPLVHEIEQAELDGKFPERPSGLCGWCPVFSCSHNRSAV